TDAPERLRGGGAGRSGQETDPVRRLRRPRREPGGPVGTGGAQVVVAGNENEHRVSIGRAGRVRVDLGEPGSTRRLVVDVAARGHGSGREIARAGTGAAAARRIQGEERRGEG